MSYDPNAEVLKNIKESKGPGQYMLKNYFSKSSHGQFNSSFGYGNSYNGKVSSQNIDSDSFLKNLHLKNTKSIIYNPIVQNVNFKPSNVSVTRSLNDTRVKKVDNTTFGVISYQQNVNQTLANKVNYNIGMDSRHQKR